MEALSSKRVALKVDVIGPENILFAGASVHLSAENFTGWGSEGVNNRKLIERFWKLKALYILKKNTQRANTHNYTNQWYTSIQNI